MVGKGNYWRMLQVNPATKEWKWLSVDDFPTGASGMVVMKSRDEGIILNLSGGLPHYSTEGWKTMTPATGTWEQSQAVATDAGYAGYNQQKGGEVFVLGDYPKSLQETKPRSRPRLQRRLRRECSASIRRSG